MNYSTLLEKAKSKGKTLLIEKYSINSSTIGRIEKGESPLSKRTPLEITGSA